MAYKLFAFPTKALFLLQFYGNSPRVGSCLISSKSFLDLEYPLLQQNMVESNGVGVRKISVCFQDLQASQLASYSTFPSPGFLPMRTWPSVEAQDAE